MRTTSLLSLFTEGVYGTIVSVHRWRSLRSTLKFESKLARKIIYVSQHNPSAGDLKDVHTFDHFYPRNLVSSAQVALNVFRCTLNTAQREFKQIYEFHKLALLAMQNDQSLMQ